MEKVLVITYYWPPSGGAGVQRWLKFCKYLPEFGVEPIVLTVNEEDAAYPVIDKSFTKDIATGLKVFKTPAKNFYKLYGAFKKRNKVPQGGVPSGNNSFKSKISLVLRNHLFVPDPRIGWNKEALKKAREIIEQEDITSILTTSPPHSSQLIGLVLKKEFPKLKWTADLRDPWTDIYYYKDLNHSNWSDQANKKKERAVLENADQLVVVSPHMKKLFASKGIDSKKINVVPNGYDQADFDELVKVDNKVFTIAYIGTANNDYDISAFLESLKELKSEGVNFQFNVIGIFSEEVEAKIYNMGLDSVVSYKGYLPHSEAIQYSQNADLLLLVIPKVENNRLIYSGKLFEYIATGNPILCIGPLDGDAAKLVTENRFGASIYYSDKDGVKSFIEQVYKREFRLADIGLKFIYSRRILSESIAKVLKIGE